MKKKDKVLPLTPPDRKLQKWIEQRLVEVHESNAGGATNILYADDVFYRYGTKQAQDRSRGWYSL